MDVEEITAWTVEANELTERTQTGDERISIEELAECAQRLAAAMDEVCLSASLLAETMIESFRNVILFPLIATPWELHMIRHAKSARIRKKYRDRVLRRWRADI